MTYCEQTLSVYHYLPCPASHGNQIIHSLAPDLEMQEKNSGILQVACEIPGSVMANSYHAMRLLKGDF